MYSKAEENYLKAIFKIYEKTGKHVHTNAIALHLDNSAASVTDMVQKLSEKNLVNYTKYKGALLTNEGKKIVTGLIRRHRLWEYFLVNKLGFGWDNVHELAEELEHIHSEELISKLDEYLGMPKYDPHGDPIPNGEGKYSMRTQLLLSDFEAGQEGVLVGVGDNSSSFLKHLDHLKIGIGTQIKLLSKVDFDDTYLVDVQGKEHNLSAKIASNVRVKMFDR